MLKKQRVRTSGMRRVRMSFPEMVVVEFLEGECGLEVCAWEPADHSFLLLEGFLAS
jgi:hypothetical protein